MKNIIWFIITVGCVFMLIGCSEDDEEANSKVKEENTEDASDLVTENTDGSSYQQEHPPELTVGTNAVAWLAQLDKYCWETEGKTCSIDPSDVQELLLNKKANSVKKGEKVTFSLNIKPGREFPAFDEISLTQKRLQEETEVEVENSSFFAPEETGKYYYLAQLKWNDELQGDAYYAFTLSVK